MIRGFPFVPDQVPDNWYPDENEDRKPSASRSVLLSAWLSGCVRRTLRTFPCTPSTLPPWNGEEQDRRHRVHHPDRRPANVMSQGGSEEEGEKRLFAALWAGDPLISIDNIERPLEGSALCSILTQESWMEVCWEIAQYSAADQCPNPRHREQPYPARGYDPEGGSVPLRCEV